MANAVWPASLPQSPLMEGFSESFVDASMRSKNSEGPDKIRRRFTGDHSNEKWLFIMTIAQLDTFITFFRTTLKARSLPFDHTRPRDGDSVTYRIREEPSWSPVDGTKYKVSCSVEKMP